jgi:hypothetical protein
MAADQLEQPGRHFGVQQQVAECQCQRQYQKAKV